MAVTNISGIPSRYSSTVWTELVRAVQGHCIGTGRQAYTEIISPMGTWVGEATREKEGAVLGLVLDRSNNGVSLGTASASARSACSAATSSLR